MIRLICSVLMVSAWLAGSAAGQTVGDGINAARRGDFASAFRIYLKLAREGVAEAQFNAGLYYQRGRAVPRDYAKAAMWYRRAADQGNAAAMLNLGAMLATGRGVAQDLTRARGWFQKAADRGYVTAQYNLGIFYAKGRGTPVDLSKAFLWYVRAARMGHAKAQFQVAVMYALGRGVARDHGVAHAWFIRAAHQRNTAAMVSLGRIHLAGLGVSKDAFQAYKWFAIAERRGHPEAGRLRDRAGVRLTDSQADDAVAEARRWRPRSRTKILMLQRMLVELGHFSQPVDGIDSRLTRRALKAYQVDQGLTPDGLITTGLLRRLSAATSLFRSFDFASVADEVRIARFGPPPPSITQRADPRPPAGRRKPGPQIAKRPPGPGGGSGASGAPPGGGDRPQRLKPAQPPNLVLPEDPKKAGAPPRRVPNRFSSIRRRPGSAGRPPGAGSGRRPVEPGARPGRPRVGSTGTGFVVSDAGHILTNRHVVAKCQRVKIRWADGEIHDAKVLAKSRNADLALVKTSIKINAIAKFRSGTPLRQGEDVAVYGFPLSSLLSSSGNLTAGTIAALAGLRDDASAMQISAPVQPGNSGGPVLDGKGRIVGVVVSKLNAIKVSRVLKDIPQNINFAIKASVATNFLESRSVPYQIDTASGQDLSNADKAAHAKKFTIQIRCFR
jgi:TPR repeat protein